MMAASADYDPYALEFDSWAALDQVIKEHGGVLRVAMWALRDIDNYGRLGVRVLASIHERLGDIGVGHLPVDLPNNQDQTVLLYKLSSEAGAVVSAVRTGAATPDAENALRKLNTSDVVQAEKVKAAKLADVAEVADDLEKLLDSFRKILNEDED